MVLKDSSYKEANFDKQNDFVKMLPKLVPFAHVQPSGLIEIAGTDYPQFILDNLSVGFTPCELLCLEIWYFLCLGVLSAEAEIHSSQKSFQTNLEILFETSFGFIISSTSLPGGNQVDGLPPASSIRLYLGMY